MDVGYLTGREGVGLTSRVHTWLVTIHVLIRCGLQDLA